MTKVEAQGYIDLMNGLMADLLDAKDEDIKCMYRGWIKTVRPFFMQAKKVLGYYKK